MPARASTSRPPAYSSTAVASSPRAAPSPSRPACCASVAARAATASGSNATAGGVLDRQPVAAQQQHRLHAVAAGEALDHLVPTRSWGRLRGRGKTLSQRRGRPGEVKKRSAVDPSSLGLNLPPPCDQSAVSSVLLPLAARGRLQRRQRPGATRPTLNVVDTMTARLARAARRSRRRAATRITDRPGADRPDGRLRFRLQHRSSPTDLPAGLPAPRGAGARPRSIGRSRACRRRDQTFDEITSAPSNGYVTDSAVAGRGGRAVPGPLARGLHPRRAALRQARDLSASQDSTVTFKVLADQNCGYQGPRARPPRQLSA